MNDRGLWMAAGLALLVASAEDGVWAGVATDGTLGPAATLVGPDFRIDEALGRRAGANLFHSFREFGVAKGESATFAGGGDIRNVISRVTGGDPTTIDGLLRSEIGNADFYFINPNGLFFGPDAEVDVPAGFHAGTAAELRFPDGARFSAVAPDAGSLSIAAPSAFGFRGAPAGAITISGSELLFQPESRVTLAAGDISIDTATIRLGGGDLALAAQGSAPGEVPISVPPGGEAQGRLTLADSHIDLTGDGGGRAQLRAGEMTLRGSALEAGNSSDRPAAGGVEVRAAELLLTGGSRISLETRGTGAGGDLRLEVEGAAVISGGARISSSSYGAGEAGAVTLHAGTLRMDGDTEIASVAEEGSSGAAGDVTVGVGGSMEMRDGAYIASDTMAAGRGGDVRVSAGELTMDGGVDFSIPGISSSTTGEGDGGRLVVEVADRLALLNGALISSSTFYGSGDAGEVVVRAGDLLLDMPDHEWVLDLYTAIKSEASNWVIAAEGLPGNILVEAGTITLRRDSHISNWSFAQVPEAELADYRPRRIVIRADRMSLLERGQIGSQTLGNLPAGNIELHIGDELYLNEGYISSESYDWTSPAGSIEIDAPGLVMLEDASISTESSGGNGGPITLRGGAALLRNGQIITSAWGAGDGGDIRLDLGALVLDNGFVQANTSKGAAGGDIQVVTPMLLIPADQQLLVGGDERIEFQADAGIDVIQAAAPEGVSGRIDAPPLTLDLSAALADLGTEFIGLAGIRQDPCGSAAASSLARGRGILGDALAAPWYGPDLPLGTPPNRLPTDRPTAMSSAVGIPIAGIGCRWSLGLNQTPAYPAGGVP